ncbi:hypothetical protein [Spirillospora sp. NPDC029432]|uniref:hypothetical protein n=1 Tax=Spirillospora sp. NPDC029432 TaxID=3154599 RepID=UPI003454C87A
MTVIGLEHGAELARRNLQIGSAAALALSALGVPAAWPFVPPLYVHQYPPQAFWDGGVAWAGAVSRVRAVREEVERLVEGVEEDGWRSEDGRAFRRRMDRHLADLLAIEIRAAAVAAVLFTAATLTMAMIVFMSMVAALLAALAAWVAVSTVFPPSAAMARLTATMTLANVNATLKAVEAAFDTALHTCAGILGTLVAGDILAEAAHGDFSGLENFVQATVDQGPMLAWGTANRVERDLTATGLGSGTPGLSHAAGAKAFHETQYNGGSQAVTGGLTPGQNADGSYSYPWE